MSDNPFKSPRIREQEPHRSRPPSKVAVLATVLGFLFAGASLLSGICTVGELNTGPRERYMLGIFAWACIIFGLIAASLLSLAKRLNRR